MQADAPLMSEYGKDIVTLLRVETDAAQLNHSFGGLLALIFAVTA